MTAESVRATPSLLDYLDVLLRRKWLFLSTLFLVPAVAIALSTRQTSVYEASAKVRLHVENVGDVGQESQFVDPTRFAQTQAETARLPAVVQRVLRSVPGTGLTVDRFLEDSSVTTSPGSDYLTVSVESSVPALAIRLATAYAHAFGDFAFDQQTSLLQARLAKAREAIARLEASGLTSGREYTQLVRRQRALETQLALLTPIAEVAAEANKAVKVAPRTVRNAAIAVFLGLVLACMAAFLADALDARVRSPDALRRSWRIPLLGEVARPPRRLARGGGLVMLADPTSHHAERFRVLRASLDFANSGTRAQTIVVTSAVDGEGKSTTAANIAVVLARAGKRVVLVDGDLRKPSLHDLFGIEGSPGLVDVELGDVELGEALRAIDLGETAGNGAGARRTGTLQVLPAGRTLPDPDQLGADAAIARVAGTLRRVADVVLIDSPPLLPVGDTIALSAHVDALLLVANLGLLNSAAVERTRRILEATPAAKLGFVLTGAEAADAYSDYRGYPYAYEGRSPPPLAAGGKEETATNGASMSRRRGSILRRPR